MNASTECPQILAAKCMAKLIKRGQELDLPPLEWTVQPELSGRVNLVGTVVGEPGELLDPSEARSIWQRWTKAAQANALPVKTLETWSPTPPPPAPRTLLESCVDRPMGWPVQIRLTAVLEDLSVVL